MKYVLLLIISLSCAVHIHQSASKQVDSLKQSKFGRTVLNLIGLHSNVQGPEQELYDAISELIEELRETINELDIEFQTRQNTHNAQILQFEQGIQDSQTDIARSEDVVNNLLIPRKEQINIKIAQLNENMQFNRDNRAENDHNRELDSQAFELLIEEYTQAIEASDDCATIISQLTVPQLLQVKQIKNYLKAVPRKSWNRVHQGPIVLALVQIALDQNFSDQGILRQIVDALNDFRSEIVTAMNDATAKENEAIQQHQERNYQLDSEYQEFQGQLAYASNELTATQQKLDDFNNLIEQRRQDLNQYTNQYNLQQESFAVETEIYNNYKDNNLRELGIAEQGLTLIKSADFQDIKI